VVGAVVHLVVLLGRAPTTPPTPTTTACGVVGDDSGGVVLVEEQPATPPAPTTTATPPGDDVAGGGWETAPLAIPPTAPARVPATTPPAGDRLGELIATGAGRRKLVKELGISDHQARILLRRARDEERVSV
ncbi:MAG: hypothetical protein ACRCZP_06670, partial [Phycicoccus sp.]